MNAAASTAAMLFSGSSVMPGHLIARIVARSLGVGVYWRKTATPCYRHCRPSPMTTPEPQPAAPPTPPFQFSLRTLLLLFVVLGSSLGVFGAWGIVVFGLVVGLADLRSSSRILAVADVSCFGRAVPDVSYWAAAARCPKLSASQLAVLQCTNNLKQIAAALQAYHQANGCFPPAYIADKSGKPMHSWRVLILPYLDRMTFTRLTISRNLGTGRRTRRSRPASRHGVCLPERPAYPGGRRCPDKLCCRGGTERRLGRREAEEARPRFRQGPPTRSWSSRWPTRASPGRNRGTCRWTRLERGRSQVARAGAVAATMADARSSSSPTMTAGVNVAMADGSVRCLGPLVFRTRTCGRCCKSAAARRRDRLHEALTARAAPELAQHRRPGRVAAFGRHAADPRGAEQEGPASFAAAIVAERAFRQHHRRARFELVNLTS